VNPYQVFVEFNDIRQRRVKVARPRTKGFMEQFNSAVLDRFFRETFRNKLFRSLEELQQDLDEP
jgi:hypothetical protein